MSKLLHVKVFQALQSVGVNASKVEPASSVSNEVWLSDEHVVRFNRRANGRLRREAGLARFLPPGLNYPRIVGYGGEAGADFLVVERLPGRPLAHTWPVMSDASRESAICQLTEQLKMLHSTPTPRGLPPLENPYLIDARFSDPSEPLRRAIEEARQLPNMDRPTLSDIEQIVEANAEAVQSFRADTLVHGDLTFENILWDGRD